MSDKWSPTEGRVISALAYVQRFSALEEAAIRARAKTDPVCEALLARTYDPRLIEVNLDHPETLQGLVYLQTVDNPLSTTTPKAKILSAERVAQILA